MVDYKKQGKANKEKGAKWELKVRKALEDLGWIVSKFRGNPNIETGEIDQAKNKFIPGRGMMLGSGFPDFVSFKDSNGVKYIQFVECKFNGELKKEEKLKLEILVKKGFRCYVAQNEEKNIRFREFLEYQKREKIHRKADELKI